VQVGVSARCRQLVVVVGVGCLFLVVCGWARAAQPLVWRGPVLVDRDTFGTRPFGLVSVSCPSVSFCAAVDYAGNVVTSSNPAGGARAWRLLHITDSFLTGVSCPAASLCVAVGTGGQVVASRDPTGGPGTWRASQLTGVSGLSAVSCPSVSLCVAVGGAGTVVSSTDPTGGASGWSTSRVATSAPSECGKGGPGEDCVANLTGVSCPSASLCVAVDSADNTVGDAISSRHPTAGPSAWSAVKIDDSNGLDGVSCPTVSSCVAVDFTGTVFTSRAPTLPGWDSATVNTGGFGNASHPPAVACGSVRLCVVTAGGGAVVSTDPLGGAGTWTAADVDGRSGYGLAAVSCVSTRLCVAVDGSGNVVAGEAVPTGTLSGAILLGGGPAPMPGRPRRAQAGEVRVYTTHGQLIARQHVRRGHGFRFKLAPGRYLLNAGNQLQHGRASACVPVKARVRSGHTTHVDVFLGCGTR
jgi:hypothetical protein